LSPTIDPAADGRSTGAESAAAIHVVVAAHNEADRIRATLGALVDAFPEATLWVADDGSSDDTAQLARQVGARVVRSERTIGKGGAMTAAAGAALTDSGGTAGGGTRKSIFVLCDGDLADSARELSALVDTIERGDGELAVAAFARRVGGGVGLALGFARWAIARRCGLVTIAPISGQRALSESALRDVLPFAAGYGMEIGMTVDAVRAGHRVVEVELDLEHRASGRTLGGFLHRARQLFDFARVYVARR
jgi:glycosyltransferase involved in cell wall biosynthesis